MSQPNTDDAKDERGFALLIVLGALLLFSYLVAQLTAAGRVESRIAGNLAANAAAKAAADGAVYQAIFNLSDPTAEHRWALDGTAHEVLIGRSRIALSLDNEAARINPNVASPALVAALLRVIGSDPERAAALADAIAEWVGMPTQSHTQSALASYQAAGLNYLPPGSPLETIGELARVRGMTADVLAALRPHLTLFGPAVPDAAVADPVVAAALALTDRRALDANTVLSSGVEALTVRIAAVAQGPGKARVDRIAVARIAPNLPNGFALLAWDSADE